MTAVPALLAAAGVGFGHAVLPDHWVPLAALGRTQRYSLKRVARLSGLAGVTHVVVSLLLGAVVIAVGLGVRSAIESAQNTIVGVLLIATGAAFGALELTRAGTHPHPHPHNHEHPHPHDHPHHSHRTARSMLAVIVPFGAAASPDLTILPVFLAASTAGAPTAIASLVVFGAVTIATIVGLTVFATLGGYQIRGRWLDRWGNVFTAAVLILIGVLVLAGVL